MTIYDSAEIYISSATSTRSKITRIDAIIDALFTTALKAAENGDVTEYSLNDGQTTIRTVYKDAAAVMASIKSYEAIKQMYINQLNGRVFRLVDSKNFKYGNR